MGKVILFSPVGGTDPISKDTIHDGALLHICRVYKPDKIFLYMSAEMLEKHKKDNRYIYCLEKLYQNLGIPLDYEIIERGDLYEVQDYNVFYSEYYGLIKTVLKSLSEDDKLLLNVSSGTPAMKSALIVLKTMGELDCAAIQVTTPTRKLNEHTHANYDVKELWELNEDNRDGFENRCSEVECPNLSFIKAEEILIKFIEQYDYSAAKHMCDALPETVTDPYDKSIEVAYHRSMINVGKAKQLSKKIEYQFFPIAGGGKTERVFEYALNLEVKLKQKKYDDFIRGITPIIVEIFAMIIKNYLQVDVLDYVSVDSIEGYKWDENKINEGSQDADIIRSVLTDQNGNLMCGYITSNDLIRIIKKRKDQFDQDLIKKCIDLREIEKKIRNVAAHQMTAITPEKIRSATSFTSDEIMNIIKDLINHTCIPKELLQWDSYERMNDYIIALIRNK